MMAVLLTAGWSLALSACGGGNGGSGGGVSEFVVISVDGGPETRYTLTADANAPYGYSPDIWSISSQPESAHVYCDEWTGSTYVMRFQLEINDFTLGVHTGSYLISDLGNAIQFTPLGGTTYSALDTGTSGTITITTVGGSGDAIAGTFDVVAIVNSIPTQTARLTGSFSTIRWLVY
jgi:hypothetical protein